MSPLEILHAVEALSVITDETKFRQEIQKLAEAQGWLVSHTGKGRKYMTPAAKGFPDLVLVRPPHVLLLECKTDEGKPGPGQRKWISRIQRCDEISAFFVAPRDAESIVSLLADSLSNQSSQPRRNP